MLKFNKFDYFSMILIFDGIGLGLSYLLKRRKRKKGNDNEFELRIMNDEVRIGLRHLYFFILKDPRNKSFSGQINDNHRNKVEHNTRPHHIFYFHVTAGKNNGIRGGGYRKHKSHTCT